MSRDHRLILTAAVHGRQRSRRLLDEASDDG